MAPKKYITNKYYGQFKPSQLVLAKMSGYAPWPAWIAEYELIQENIFRSRKDPKTLPVLFPEANYTWLKEKDVQPLTLDMIRERLKNVKKKKIDPALKRAFEDILNGLDYQSFREKNNWHEQETNNYYDEEQSEEEDRISDECNDQNNGEGHQGNLSRKQSRKKRESDSEDDVKPPKRTKTASASASSTPPVSDKSLTKKVKSEINGSSSEEPEARKRKAKHEHPHPHPHPASLDGTAQENKEKETAWRFRYVLQKGLIQRKTEPTAEDLQSASDVLDELKETNNKAQFTVDLLKYTKLHKVLREILKKEDLAVPPYNLHDKSRAILENWAPLLEALRKEKHNGNGGASSAHSAHHNRDLSDVSELTAVKDKANGHKDVKEGV